MATDPLRITYLGGPTALIEIAGLRLLTDPTFDPAGSEYPTPVYTLHKLGPAGADAHTLGPIDAVLLSHDHHFDNLDRAGRALLPHAGRVLTTTAGAERLAGNATGLAPWQSVDLPTPDDRVLRITATPARHGPPDGDRGPVVGFAIAFADAPSRALYVSGDTVWYEGVAEVTRRFDIRTAVLFMGAARVAVAGPHALTMTAADAIAFARACPQATLVPLHFEDWQHFSESRADITRAFAEAHLTDRLRWLPRGQPTALDL